MPLNPDYMLAPSLEEYFVDKDTGLPLAGGIVTFYSDIDRTILKPVFELSGAPPNYSYTQLPNPLTLSGTGLFVDFNGNNVLPYYYPFDADGEAELYYITVYSAGGILQFTRQGFPNFTGDSGATSAFNYNFVRNAQFAGWANLPAGISGYTNVRSGSVSNFDFVTDDWIYTQDDPTQTVVINRGVFGSSNTIVPFNPTYYFSYQKSGLGSGVATFNIFEQQYQSVQTLAGQEVSFSCRINGSGAAPINMSVTLVQYFGSGGGSAQVVTNLVVNPSITPGWTQITGTATVPSISGKTIGTGGDDSLILRFNFPTNQLFSINIANVQLQVGSSITAFDEISIDDQLRNTDTRTNYATFYTGDIKPTLRYVADPGWLMMDDTTIGNIGSGANHIAIDCYNLFSMIWDNVGSLIYSPIYDSAGLYSTFGASAQADWDAQKRLALTKILGRALSGVGTSITTSRVTAVTTGGGTSTLAILFGVLRGTPFQVSSTGTLPTGLAALTTYYAIPTTGTIFKIASTAANAVAQNADITLSSAGSGNITVTLMDVSNFVLGSFYGQQDHNIIGAELPVTNTSLNTTSTGVAAGAVNINNPTNGGATVVSNTSSFGASNAMNIIQPTAFLNMMIKL